MKALIIYNNQNDIYGIFSKDSSFIKEGVNYEEIDIPEGKLIAGIDTSVTPFIPSFIDIPGKNI